MRVTPPSHFQLRFLAVLAAAGILQFAVALAADPLPEQLAVTLDPVVHSRCLDVLRWGLHSDRFWHAIHAAEGLTAAGQPQEVQSFLAERLAVETDDQRRCGLARELVRAGDRRYADVLLAILAGPD